MVKDSQVSAGKNRQRDKELLADEGAEAGKAAQVRRQQQAVQGRDASRVDAPDDGANPSFIGTNPGTASHSDDSPSCPRSRPQGLPDDTCPDRDRDVRRNIDRLLGRPVLTPFRYFGVLQTDQRRTFADPVGSMPRHRRRVFRSDPCQRLRYGSELRLYVVNGWRR